MVNTRATKYDEETTAMDVSEILKFLQQGRQEDRDEAERRQEDRDEAERRHQEICESQQVINTRLNAFSGRIDGVEQQIDQVGFKVNRIEKVVEENKEEIERKLEDTRRQVQKEILERIEGLGHQLHRTSITDLEHGSTSSGTPLQHSSLMHAERSVHKILKPPTYDGQSSWSMYRRQFEAAAKANGWTSQEMATSLVISLRGQALEILQSIPEEQQNDYDRIVGALEIRYGHKYLRQVYQSQIKSKQQRSNESLQEYEADIERLVHLAYPQAPKLFDDPMLDRPPRRPPPTGPPKAGNQQQKRPAETAQSGPSQNKQAKPTNRRKGPKRKGQQQNKTVVGHDKAPLPGARLTYQRRNYYQVLCTSAGTRQLCEIVFQSIQFRGFRTANNGSLQQLTYCTVIALWARSASVAIDLGYLSGDISDLSHLLKAVKGLQPPAVLAKYIETVGSLTLSSGAKIVPWFASRDAMENRHFDTTNPDDLLREAERPIPHNYWSIDRAWIAEWSQVTTRPSRLGMQFRAINWAETTGCVEMIVTPIRGEADDLGQKKLERRKWDIEITSEKFGKRQLVDARGRVSTTYTQCPKISVSKISSDERSLIVHGYLDDKWCSFVIDTGATRTILRPDILPKPPKELSKHVKLETATGELIPVHGEVNVKTGIIVEEDIQIPQGSENIIIAKLDGNSEGLSTRIVEASERNDGLLVARSLVQMDNQIPARIANISDKIILKKNEVLGRCEPVERIVKCEEVNQAQLNQAKKIETKESSYETGNELLMATTIQVEDEWSSKELKKSQKKDSELKLIRNWVKNGVRPTWQEFSFAEEFKKVSDSIRSGKCAEEIYLTLCYYDLFLFTIDQRKSNESTLNVDDEDNPPLEEENILVHKRKKKPDLQIKKTRLWHLANPQTPNYSNPEIHEEKKTGY
ncbi:hypothetical protein NQ318_022535 [Aromia moschata]|uniref:Peptidase A2 domain-containing protein n=1 Tax=Aromia moschata TaxID=1265417 RepID=A0AAV8XKQ6_9CUCU|nr:hypothetical protein NQ318_022535 [Aromia moschata]